MYYIAKENIKTTGNNWERVHAGSNRHVVSHIHYLQAEKTKIDMNEPRIENFDELCKKIIGSRILRIITPCSEYNCNSKTFWLEEAQGDSSENIELKSQLKIVFEWMGKFFLLAIIILKGFWYTLPHRCYKPSRDEKLPCNGEPYQFSG